MTLRFQRLLIILISFFLISGAIILILINARNNIIFFYTPSELIESDLQINQTVRVGGFVKKNTLRIMSDTTNYITFTVTDKINDIIVEYEGILPDLFREKQGTVVEGKLLENYHLKAVKVFAKHDENYMPASIKKQLKQSGHWKKDY